MGKVSGATVLPVLEHEERRIVVIHARVEARRKRAGKRRVFMGRGSFRGSATAVSVRV
jgi:hypothetical protein